jgi:putative endopeptidase
MTRSGIDLTALDPAVRPQDDLYAHVNGRWVAEHVIPADRAMDGSFRALHDQAEEQVRDIITEAGAAADATGVQAQIGALYASFMDTDAVEAAGVEPLRPDLEAIEAATTREQLTDVLGALQRTGAAGGAGFWVDNDAKDPERYVVYLYQSGLGLPDESYYRDEQYAAVLAAYRPHVARMLRLGGWAADEAAADDAAGRVVALEAKIAAGHWDVVKDRDADLTYNPTTGRPGPARSAPRRGRSTSSSSGSRRSPPRSPGSGRPSRSRTGRPGWRTTRSPRGRRTCRPSWSRRTSTSTAAP